MTLVSCNIEGVLSNKIYTQHIMENCSIIGIQEHWLWTAELNALDTLSPDWAWHAHAADHSECISLYQRPRGWGGVALLWHNSIKAKKLNQGNERIVCITIDTDTKPTLIVCVYMPSPGYNSSVKDYRESLDHLAAICEEFTKDHDIIILGDMNASLSRHTPNKQDGLLCSFLKGATLVPDPIENYTFLHHSGRGSSKIDFIIHHAGNTYKPKTYQHMGEHPSNSSSHRAIQTKVDFKINQNTKKIVKNKASGTKIKLMWEHADPAAFKNTFAEWMTPVKLPTPESNLSMEMYAAGLVKAIQEATRKAVPAKILNFKSARRPLPKDVLSFKNKARKIFQEWVDLGKQTDSESYGMLRKAKYELRKAQRQHRAQERDKTLNEIQKGPSESNFHRLINCQKGSRDSLPDVLVSINGESSYSEHNQANLLTQHYKVLANPQNRPEFDDHYLDQASSNVCIRGQPSSSYNEVTELEAKVAISQLNKRKAPDPDGLGAEHLILGQDTITKALCPLFNAILRCGHLPGSMKSGNILSIPKKGKDPQLPDHHRGITIGSILTKTFEIIHINREGSNLDDHQSELQFGFTRGISPLVAAVMVSEAIAVAQDTKTELFMASLDAKKAFDVVNHDILLDTVSASEASHNLLSATQACYKNINSSVSWKGQQGEEFRVNQGVRQGGILSTHLYKLYLDPLLQSLQADGLGFSFGATYCGAPTCADDVFLIARSEWELQAMLDRAAKFANERRYILHPQKSCIMIIGAQKLTPIPSLRKWTLNGKEVPIVDSLTHLGIDRSSKCDYTNLIQERISKARRTAGALLGAGLHGSNGVGTNVALQIYNTYVLPVYLFGLEAIVLGPKCISLLEAYHSSVVKQIQGLPTRCSTAAAYLMSSCLPMEAQMDLRRLSLFRGMACSSSGTMRMFILTQASLCHKGSWVRSVMQALHKYDLPDLIEMINSSKSAEKWKYDIKAAVQTYWHEHLSTEAAGKSTLTFFCPPPRGQCHTVWDFGHGLHKVRQATIKARMITGVYILQSQKARFNQFKVDATCPLCNEGDEDMEHFVLRCSSTKDIRLTYLGQLDTLISGEACSDLTTLWKASPLQCVLDYSQILSNNKIDADLLYHLEDLTRRFCYALHSRRQAILNIKPRRKREGNLKPRPSAKTRS